MGFNHLEGSGVFTDCGLFGKIETRHTGFLMGNVVDMFKFQANWPEWMPFLAGREVFPAIWNVADASITSGVILIFIRQRKYFPKVTKKPSSIIETEKTND
jgi:signal peptidase II